MALKLRNEQAEFTFASTGLESAYSDDGQATVRLTARRASEPGKLHRVELRFSVVAELACRTVNFHESLHGELQIQDAGGRHSGFYRVVDSQRLAAVRDGYDPRNRFDLKHYIVVGGDGYVELIASGYVLNATMAEAGSS